MSSLFGSGGGGRKGAYNKADDAGASREERMNRLKFELREHIRFLADYELLSTDWLRMAESLHQIANVAFMETHLPPSEDNPLKQEGKKDSGTLWDQERDELAVRILLEEGKLNLALRILHRYRQATRDAAAFTATVQSTSAKFGSDVQTVLDRCRVFEQSVGTLLLFAFGHIEALQIMDLPEFVQHCAEIIREAEASSRAVTPVEVGQLQETLVLHYLSSLGKRMEDLDEDRVMDLVHEHALMPTLISHMAKHYTWYKQDALEHSLRFLQGCMSSESFQADRARFLPPGDKALLGQLVSLKALYVTELTTASPAGLGFPKKECQAVLDEIAKVERTAGAAGLEGVVKEAVPLRDRLAGYKAAEAREKERVAAAAAAGGADKLKSAPAAK